MRKEFDQKKGTLTHFDETGRAIFMEHTDDPRERVILPTCQPEARPDVKEGYDVVGTRSKSFSGSQHRGPYVVLWKSAGLVSNPAYKQMENGYYPQDIHSYLDPQYVVSHHDEDQCAYEELLRTLDKAEAYAFFASLQEDYPEGAPYPGMPTRGAGRPTTLDDPVVVAAEMPRALRDALDAEARRQSATAERKVSRNEIIRELLQKSLSQ
jgi:hypothetical protein